MRISSSEIDLHVKDYLARGLLVFPPPSPVPTTACAVTIDKLDLAISTHFKGVLPEFSIDVEIVVGVNTHSDAVGPPRYDRRRHRPDR